MSTMSIRKKIAKWIYPEIFESLEYSHKRVQSLTEDSREARAELRKQITGAPGTVLWNERQNREHGLQGISYAKQTPYKPWEHNMEPCIIGTFPNGEAE